MERKRQQPEVNRNTMRAALQKQKQIKAKTGATLSLKQPQMATRT
jgi:hypothetical protein